MTRLAQAATDYLATRRALGFKLERSGDLLAQFVGFAEEIGLETVTLDAALRWATTPADADPSWWATRLSVVRQFALWQSAFDPATEVPPADVLARRSRRADPYPFTDDDIAALLRAARSIPIPLKAATYETLIGLLAVSGMRVGETIGLDRGDVELNAGLVVVRHAKFDKSRELPLHPSTVDALSHYGATRDHFLPAPDTSAFFVSTVGTRLIYNNVHRMWLTLADRAGLTPLSARCRPRPHDLRHRFAVNTLIGWYRDGVDVEAQLPKLSTYLGHREPHSTYWYLRAAPELLALAVKRLDRAAER